MNRPALARREVQKLVADARTEAIMKHGSLQGGMKRWAHHLKEECVEAVVEMEKLHKLLVKYPNRVSLILETRGKLIEELAQVAQLSEEMLILLVTEREFEGEETWRGK